MDNDILSNLLTAVEETTAEINGTRRLKEDPNFLQVTKINTESLVHTGLTDSSDDEDNRDFEHSKYNTFGKAVKAQLINDNSSTSSSQSSIASNWKLKPKHPIPDERQLQIPQAHTKSIDVYTDPVFGIRIVNPLISSTTLKDRMQGRQAVSLMKLRLFVENVPAKSDWVVAGVIVHKTGRTSQKGNSFSIWTLTDMHGDLKTFSLFLFRSAYKDLWKCSLGTVIGVLNPSVFEKKDGSKDEVCRKFNDIGSNLLSRGFLQIEKRHATLYKRVKGLLPRRESERRAHPLFRHCDVLSAVETRISMLNMTYMKYIQSNVCCFIPGKVLDELVKVLNIVEKTRAPPRPNEVLQELRDISSMAMEYFDDKILPMIRGQSSPAASQYQPTVHTIKTPKLCFVQPALQEEIGNVTKVNRRQRTEIKCLSKEIQKLYTRIQKQKTRIKAQAHIIKEHNTKIQQQEEKSAQQDTTITELKKHIGDWENKLNKLTAEVASSREDIVKAIFPLPAKVNPTPKPSPQLPKTVIRPRVSQVQTPNTYIVELERKRKASIDMEIPNKLRFIMKQDPNVKNLMDQGTTKINENITQNIAKDIRREAEDTTKKKYDFARLLSTSMDAFIKNSLGSIKARKRRHTACSTDVLVDLH